MRALGKNSNNFEARWQFPHCIGAIDGKHINIEFQNLSGSEFQNYNFFPSFVGSCRCELQIYLCRYWGAWK